MRVIRSTALLLIAGILGFINDESAVDASKTFDHNEAGGCVSQTERETMEEFTHSHGKIDAALAVYCNKVEMPTNCTPSYTKSLRAAARSDEFTMKLLDMLNGLTLLKSFPCTNRKLVKDAIDSPDVDCFFSKLKMMQNCSVLTDEYNSTVHKSSPIPVIERSLQIITFQFVSSFVLGNGSRWQTYKRCSVKIFEKCEDKIFSKLMDLLLNFLDNQSPKIDKNIQPEPGLRPIISIWASTLHSLTIGWMMPLAEPKVHVDQYFLVLIEPKYHTSASYEAISATENSFVFKNLVANSVYRIFAAACRNETSESVKCFGYNAVDAFTLDRDPIFIPTLLTLASDSVSSIMIGWLPPPPELRDRIHRYKVTTRVGIGELGPIYLDKTAKSYVFRDLWRGLDYRFSIAACSEFATQCGNWSSELDGSIAKRELYPKFTPNVTVLATTSDSIKIGWSVPSPKLQDSIHQYSVMPTLYDKILGPVHVAGNTNSYVFKNLTFNTTYQFRVAACPENITQCGYWSPEQEGLTIDRDPKFIPTVWVEATTLHSIKIRWSMPSTELRDRVHQYKLMATHQDEMREPVFYFNETDNTYIFENLSSLTDYHLKVAACSEYATQCGNWSSEETGRTIDRDLKFVPTAWTKTTRNSITIGWSTPSPDLRELRQYQVMASNRNDTRGPVYVNETVHSYTFGNLTSKTSYLLKVAACSEYITQCGDWSSERDVLTIEKDEVAPDVMGPILACAIVLLIALVVWMVIRKRREIAARKKFMEETLERFDARAIDCLDMELNVGDQADVLPYDPKWEYPRTLLKLDDKILGSGAFGIVKKAKAKSICRPEAITTVAVKMVRATFTLNHMTALSRELKILSYLGKHRNIVNLLGACTNNVSYGELFVIVEFCRFGNLRDFLVSRRADFDDEVGSAAVGNIAVSSSSMDRVDSNDNGGDALVSDNALAMVDCDDGTESRDSSISIADCGPGTNSVALGLQSKYEGDYTDLNLEPIDTDDLLCWAWQVARGMKFLGFRRILHGDLAARNILLADNNVVKICDFGLAQTLYTDENYEKKDGDPLPIKWMAMESLKDRIFSAKSDVWSYGIVLWEMFTLGETPYPGIRARNVYLKLAEGYRMAQPKYATLDIYHMMLKCWDASPSTRPSFQKIVNVLSDLMDEGITLYYLDLDPTYTQTEEVKISTNERIDHSTTNPHGATSSTTEQIMESGV